MSRDVKGAISFLVFYFTWFGAYSWNVGREFLPWPLSQLEPQKTKKLFPGLHQGRIQKICWYFFSVISSSTGHRVLAGHF